MLDVRRGAITLSCLTLGLARCGGSLHQETGKGGGGGISITGLGGAAGAGASCPRAPDSNDPECHPEDQGLWAAGSPVPALDGECTTGRTCDIPVGVNNSCEQALGLQTFVCCPAIFPNVVVASLVPMHSGFVPGATVDACPQPEPGQDPACALPLAATCPVEGLQCFYRSTFGAGLDAGCYECRTHVYLAQCCGGAWTTSVTCPTDAGMD